MFLHSTFCPIWCFSIRRFVPFSVFSIQCFFHLMFCPIRPFVPFDVSSIRCFVPFGVFSIRCFVPFGVLSFDVLSFDVLSIWRLLLRHFVGEPNYVVSHAVLYPAVIIRCSKIFPRFSIMLELQLNRSINKFAEVADGHRYIFGTCHLGLLPLPTGCKWGYRLMTFRGENTKREEKTGDMWKEERGKTKGTLKLNG